MRSGRKGDCGRNSVALLGRGEGAVVMLEIIFVKDGGDRGDGVEFERWGGWMYTSSSSSPPSGMPFIPGSFGIA